MNAMVGNARCTDVSLCIMPYAKVPASWIRESLKVTARCLGKLTLHRSLPKASERISAMATPASLHVEAAYPHIRTTKTFDASRMLKPIPL